MVLLMFMLLTPLGNWDGREGQDSFKFARQF